MFRSFIGGYLLQVIIYCALVTSSGLRSEEIWTAELMDNFLESPLEVYPGIRMVFAGLKKEKDQADLICYLKEHTGEK